MSNCIVAPEPESTLWCETYSSQCTNLSAYGASETGNANSLLGNRYTQKVQTKRLFFMNFLGAGSLTRKQRLRSRSKGSC